MKLTVLNWIASWLLDKIAKIIEVSFRILLLLLPLGVYLLLVQNRSKVSSFSSLSIYAKAESVWQHVFPGFMIVSVDKDSLRNWVTSKKNAFQDSVEKNKYVLSFLVAFSLVLIMVLMYIK